MSNKVNEVARLLEEHESAPSAVILVLSTVLGSELPDDVCDLAYETSEGANDRLRDAVLNWMTDAQLEQVKQDILCEIVEEELLD